MPALVFTGVFCTLPIARPDPRGGLALEFLGWRMRSRRRKILDVLVLGSFSVEAHLVTPSSGKMVSSTRRICKEFIDIDFDIGLTLSPLEIG